jgi:hypothetical protein
MSLDQTASPVGDYLSDFDGSPVRRPARRARSRHWRGAAVSLVAIGSITAMILLRNRTPDADVTALPAMLARVDFTMDDRLAPMLAFGPPAGSEGRARYESRARQGLGERWDTLTLGDVNSDELMFRVTLHTATSALAEAPSLFVALAKQASEVGAAIVHATSAQLSTADELPTEWADITLAATNGERRCIGFRFTRLQMIDLSGFACGARSAALDQAGLRCLIERLSPTAAGAEIGLRQMLKGKAARDQACLAAG